MHASRGHRANHVPTEAVPQYRHTRTSVKECHAEVHVPPYGLSRQMRGHPASGNLQPRDQRALVHILKKLPLSFDSLVAPESLFLPTSIKRQHRNPVKLLPTPVPNRSDSRKHAWRRGCARCDKRCQPHRSTRDLEGVPDVRLRLIRWYLLRLRLWVHQRRACGLQLYRACCRPCCQRGGSCDRQGTGNQQPTHLSDRLHPVLRYLLRCAHRW